VGEFDELLLIACLGQVSDDPVAVGGVDGLPAPVPAHHHVPAGRVGLDPFDRLRVVVHGALVGDNSVAVEGKHRQRRVDARVQLIVGDTVFAQRLPVLVALLLLVGDDRFGDLPGTGEHGPAVPARCR
jgi:hypothetical protein